MIATYIANVFVKKNKDGKIIICGYFTKYNNISANGIVRLNSNGSLDTTFNF
jgi:hypothetical protein